MINFNVKQEGNFEESISSLKKRIITVLWDMVEKLTEVAEDTAQETIFESKVKGFQKRTGDFKSDGLSKVQKTLKSKDYSVMSILWSRAGDLFENFKDRKKVRLYSNLKKYFLQNSKINSITEKASEDLANGF